MSRSDLYHHLQSLSLENMWVSNTAQVHVEHLTVIFIIIATDTRTIGGIINIRLRENG